MALLDFAHQHGANIAQMNADRKSGWDVDQRRDVGELVPMADAKLPSYSVLT